MVSLHNSRFSMAVHGGDSASSQESTDAQWNNLTLCQVFHCCSLRWICVSHSLTGCLYIVSDFSLLLTGVALQCPNCTNETTWGFFVSVQVSHCFLLWWLCVVPGVLLLLIEVSPLPLIWLALHHPRHPTAPRLKILGHFRYPTAIY